jgi:hypothetical protein
VEFAQRYVNEHARLQGGDILVGQSQILRPHGFFQKQSFGPLPERLQALNLKVDGCDLAHRKIQKSQEEEKGSGISDDRSNVSVLTTKTNKTQRGKALNKHCSLCDF